MKLSTIHIFGYGEAQIISDTLNFKTGLSNLKTLQAVIDDIKSKKPDGKKEADFHSINIFADMRVDYNAKKEEVLKPKDKNEGSFSFKFSELNSDKLNALIADFESLSKA